jgi:hypothetical protein
MIRMKHYILYVLTAGLIYLLPSQAFSFSEIEFYVTNNTGAEKCFQCSGPFSRVTPRVNIGANGGSTYFYTAAVTSFSPYGLWHCFVYITDSCLDEGPIPDEDTFETGVGIPAGVAVVNLSIAEAQGTPVINVSFPGLGAPDGSEVSVASSLGDDPLTGKEDRDTFRIKAEEGDQVTIRLDGDPSAGHIGSHARLRLISDRRIGHFEEVESGELPLEITTTIPETGVYEVIVGKIAQSDVPDNLLSFRGGYILSLDSSADAVRPLIPGENVEN